MSRFGSELRRLRKSTGQSQRALGVATHVSQGHISDIERGRKRPTLGHVRRLDVALSASGVLVRAWEHAQVNEYASWFLDVLAVERNAEAIFEYQPLVIPGLLQTEGYARAQLDPTPEREAQLTARLSRQDVLFQARYVAVIEEHVLRRPIGGWTVLADQLDHLINSDTTVHVVTQDATSHPGSDGPFVLYAGKSDVVYVENRISGAARDDYATVRDYRERISELRGIALPPSESRKLVSKIRGEIHAH